jgi:hypothetical protein
MSTSPAFYESPGVRSERFASAREAKAALTQQIERQGRIIQDRDRQGDQYGGGPLHRSAAKIDVGVRRWHRSAAPVSADEAAWYAEQSALLNAVCVCVRASPVSVRACPLTIIAAGPPSSRRSGCSCGCAGGSFACASSRVCTRTSLRSFRLVASSYTRRWAGRPLLRPQWQSPHRPRLGLACSFRPVLQQQRRQQQQQQQRPQRQQRRWWPVATSSMARRRRFGGCLYGPWRRCAPGADFALTVQACAG